MEPSGPEDSEAIIAELAARRPYREGRGRLHTIDKLPPEANDAIHWACTELAARNRTQQDILFEFNDRLEQVGCQRISAASFNRYSMRKAMALRNLAEVTAVGRVVAEVMTPDKSDDVTKLIAQMIKEAAYNILERGKAGSKELMELGRALNLTVTAIAKSDDQRRRWQDELDKASIAAADRVCETRPELDRADVLRKIREEVYGIFDERAAK